MMEEFDIILYRLQNILKENVTVEDDRIYISRKTGYDVFNLIEEIDKGFIEELLEQKGMIKNG